MSKPVLYTFGGSVWAAVPELAIAELGYAADAIEVKTVNLVEGQNFKPSFVQLNPHATLPTLEAEGKVYTNTTDVTSYLVKNAPTKVKTGDAAFIATIHDDKYDPNFAMLLSRTEEELKAKGDAIAGSFLSNRQAALEKYSATPEAASLKSFYDTKLEQNGGLLSIYQSKAPKEVIDSFFEKSQAHFAAITYFILETLPEHLPKSGFRGGDRPGEDDFHLGAWIARIAATVGAKSGDDGLKAFEDAFGKPVPESVADYWNAWSGRDSWKKVYADGIH